MASKGYVDAFNRDSVGSIEIANIRRTFYTATSGSPNVLFPLLLGTAGEAYAAAFGGGQKKDATAHHRAAIYMAGLLVRDGIFLLGQADETRGHRYSLDFTTGTLQLWTHLYIKRERCSSFFNIRVEGSIQGGPFVVRNLATGHVLARVPEKELKKSNFFTEELPLLCSYSQNDAEPADSPASFSSDEQSLNSNNSAEDHPVVCSQTPNDPVLPDAATSPGLLDKCFELWLPIDLAGTRTMVVVSKDEGEPQGQAQDPNSGQFLCYVPLDYFHDLSVLLETLPILLTETRPVAQLSPLKS